MRQKNLNITICFILLFLVGCTSSNLSRNEAKKLLKEKIEKAPKITAVLPTGYVVVSQMPSASDFGLDMGGMVKKELRENDYKMLEEKKCLILRNWGDTILGKKYYVSIEPDMEKYILKSEKSMVDLGTRKGKKLAAAKFKNVVLLGEAKVGEILGITEPSEKDGKKVCYVDFNVIIDKTPFGQVLIKSKFQKSPLNFSAQFVLYDDGWHLEKMQVRDSE